MVSSTGADTTLCPRLAYFFRFPLPYKSCSSFKVSWWGSICARVQGYTSPRLCPLDPAPHNRGESLWDHTLLGETCSLDGSYFPDLSLPLIVATWHHYVKR